ncbi:MAG: ABC transporter substrate-binding protein [Thaumarchaeota archaeon]|nr:ABC transporter substrate-binding protein [Nitrososphaerota archaeon]
MRRKGASSATAAALLVVGLLVGAGVTYAATSSGSKSTTTVTATGGLSGTITIGQLTDLSGELSSIGSQAKIAVGLAITDINAYLPTVGVTNVKFASISEDTGSNPATALTDLQTLSSDGVQVVIGPLTSSEVSNVLSYSESNHIVLISPSSTAISLAGASPYLFRDVPNDAAQSFAIARALVSQNVTDIIPINQQSVYGTGLANATINRFVALGGHASAEIQYATTVSDFTPTLTTAQSEYQSAVSTYGASHVAVVAIGFQEVGQMLVQMKSSFPSLLSATWYGSDGESQNTDFTNSTSAAAPVAAQVKLLSTIGQSPVPSAKTVAFYSEFNATAHTTPVSYATNAYDATWIAALSILAAGSNTGQAISKALPSVADNYYGASGWTELQPQGQLGASHDEAPVGYDVYGVATVGGTTQWVLEATYSSGTDAITWQPGMP